MTQSSTSTSWLHRSGFQQWSPGLMLSAVVAIAASFVAEHYGGPKYLYALLMGMAFHHLSQVERYAPGIEFTAKKLVRFGVALLGLRILLSDLHDLGWLGVVALLSGLVLTIGFGVWMSKRLGLPKSLGLLSGGGTAICGISATLALSATMPQNKEVEEMTLLTAIGIAAFSTVAMVLYPLLVVALSLTQAESGLFLGGAIHDVAQVVGAGYIISPDVADSATLAKMFRVSMLMPVVVVFSLAFGKSRDAAAAAGSSTKKAPLIPMFLVVFVALAVLNNTVALPAQAVGFFSDLSGWCLVISIAALGVKTSLAKLSELGWRPIVLLASEAVFIASWMLAMVFVLRYVA
jgi:uncharacterized integral membrane protein (TIGR00698 family)